ncbi:hypothetical protein CULC809_00026 [Corynebacterium ulcerans 809]|nr:hypothetical protein CULC809_00026 [Corynebacterium ulcerans 809]
MYGIRDEVLAEKLFALQRLLHAKIFLQQVLAKQHFLKSLFSAYPEVVLA